MSRLYKIGDALSQLANVALLPQVHKTTANESISGRAHRCGWTKTERVIDWLFSWVEQEHCRLSYEADRKRAIAYLVTEPRQSGASFLTAKDKDDT